jgi:hypothetical protein
MEAADTKPRHGHIPRFAKIIILTQAAIILGFTVGMYQEYLNNTYLQQYVIALFTSNIIADATLSMVTASVFALGTFTLLGSMGSAKKTNKELKSLSESPEEEFDISAIPVLETMPSRRRASSRARRRRPRTDNDDIFRSMTRHKEENTN